MISYEKIWSAVRAYVKCGRARGLPLHHIVSTFKLRKKYDYAKYRDIYIYVYKYRTIFEICFWEILNPDDAIGITNEVNFAQQISMLITIYQPGQMTRITDAIILICF